VIGTGCIAQRVLAPKILALPKILSLDFLSCMRVFSEIHWVFGRI